MKIVYLAKHRAQQIAHNAQEDIIFRAVHVLNAVKIVLLVEIRNSVIFVLRDII